MQGFIKTLFGDRRTFLIAAINIVIVFALMKTPAASLAGIILPLGVFCGAVYLAKH
jgi:hypothetical protein